MFTELKFLKWPIRWASRWSMKHVQQLALPAAMIGVGHFEPASRYGMAADQALVREVIRGTGNSVTASPTQKTDLYWAFGGGRGGPYGILFSLTSKIRQDSPLRCRSVFRQRCFVYRHLPCRSCSWQLVLHNNPLKLVDPGVMTN